MKIRARFYLVLGIGLFLVVVLIDSLGVFDSRSYNEVPHGSHTHFVPKDCNPPLGVRNSPMRRPTEDEHITCDGQIISN